MAKNFPKLTIDNKTKMQKLREHMRQGYRSPKQMLEKHIFKLLNKMKMKRKY